MLKYQFQFQHMINLINSDKQLTLTYLSKGTPCSVQYMVTIILQIEFECLESGAYKIRTNVANLRQDLLFGSDILDIGRVLE